MSRLRFKIKNFWEKYPSQVILAWVLFGVIMILSGGLIFKTLNARAQATCDAGNVLGWSWNPYFGWISLSSANFTYPDDHGCYGVKVDADSYKITGLAWNGWGSDHYLGSYICFGETCNDLPVLQTIYSDAVVYDDTPDSGVIPPTATYDPATNQVSGWARFVGWGDDQGAWIKLSGSNFGLKIYQRVEGIDGYLNQWTFGGGDDPVRNSENFSWNGGLGWIKWQPKNTECYCTTWGDWSDWGRDLDVLCGQIRTRSRDCVLSSCSESNSETRDSSGSGSSPTVDLNFDQCGVIKLSLDNCVVSRGCDIYRSLTSDGCGGCFITDGCGYTFSSTGCSNCLLIKKGQLIGEFFDTTFLPRTNYWYWVAGVDDIGTITGLTTVGPARSNCFPGSGSHE